MGILLSLCDSRLGLAVSCQKLAESIGDALLYEGYQLILNGLIVISEAYKGCLLYTSNMQSLRWLPNSAMPL